jgi:hypothetical protein
MRRMLLLALVFCFGILFSSSPASAQAPVPVQTFTSSYSGFNPWIDWEWWLTPSQKCTENQAIYGAKPTAPGKYPLFVYTHGTLADWGQNAEGKRIVQLAAAQGFVAVALTYDSWITLSPQGVAGHAYCMYDQPHQGNAISAACAIPEADCSKGILVSGFSQGGAISAVAKNFNSNVVAAWPMGFSGPNLPQLIATSSGGTRALPNNKLRITNGQADVTNQGLSSFDPSVMGAISGNSCGSSWNCLQTDGSGYYIVQNAEVGDGYADHCFWMQVNTASPKTSCTLSPTQLDPGFQPPATTTWSMISNLDWLRAQLLP